MPNSARLDEWLAKGFNAEMEWMSRTAEARKHPNHKTAWVSLWKYPRPLSPRHEPIAAYAHGRDYHLTISETLRKWAKQIGGQAFCDSSPLAERELAVMAGLGFIGRNTMLINPKFGSAFFIGGILVGEVSPSLQPPAAFSATPSAGDTPATPPFCSHCRKCIDACPNQALSDGFLDSRKCAAYLTIEHRGDFTEEQKKLAGISVFGCDICQRVCPYNARHLKESPPYFSPELSQSGEWKKSIIKNTPLWRAGVKGLRRNSENCLM